MHLDGAASKGAENVTDTYQFDDYSKYRTSGLNEARKAQKKVEVFPEDCRKAFEMGVRFAGQ